MSGKTWYEKPYQNGKNIYIYINKKIKKLIKIIIIIKEKLDVWIKNKKVKADISYRNANIHKKNNHFCEKLFYFWG